MRCVYRLAVQLRDCLRAWWGRNARLSPSCRRRARWGRPEYRFVPGLVVLEARSLPDVLGNPLAPLGLDAFGLPVGGDAPEAVPALTGPAAPGARPGVPAGGEELSAIAVAPLDAAPLPPPGARGSAGVSAEGSAAE